MTLPRRVEPQRQLIVLGVAPRIGRPPKSPITPPPPRVVRIPREQAQVAQGRIVGTAGRVGTGCWERGLVIPARATRRSYRLSRRRPRQAGTVWIWSAGSRWRCHPIRGGGGGASARCGGGASERCGELRPNGGDKGRVRASAFGKCSRRRRSGHLGRGRFEVGIGVLHRPQVPT